MIEINKMIEDGDLTRAASIIYDALLCIINEQSPNMHITRENWKKVTPKLAECLEDPSIVIPEPTEDPGDDIEILKDKATLTITYLGPGENSTFKAPAKVNKKIYIGATYNIVSPEVEGYVPDKDVITGKMTEDGADYIVTYTEAEPATTAQLKITYVCPQGYTAPDAVAQDVTVGESYSVASPIVEGCTPDKDVIEGIMVAGGVTETVTYAETPVVRTGTLLITYEGPDDGVFVAPAEVEAEYGVGEEFMIPSPEVAGYKPDKASVSGAMVAEGIVETVTYTAV